MSASVEIQIVNEKEITLTVVTEKVEEDWEGVFFAAVAALKNSEFKECIIDEGKIIDDFTTVFPAHYV